MTSIREALRRRFAPSQPIPSGIYHYIAPPEADFAYRLHLRIEPDGSGLLIINAATVLHLNQSAAEYAYYLVQETDEDLVVRQISARYQVTKNQALQDYRTLREQILTMVHIPDLDPVTYLNLEREAPYSGQITAPYRLDCALTYALPEGATGQAAPTRRVDRELATAEWKNILDQTWQAGIPHIVFTGGEPTLRDDLPELITHSEALGQVTGLLTDGLKLADPEYLHLLLQTGLDHLLIVLNPQDEKSWRAIEQILPEDIQTTVHLTIQPENAAEISALIERLDDLGVSHLSLSASNANLAEALQSGRDKAAELDIALAWDLPVPYSALNPVALETEQDEAPQGAGRAWLYIEPDGDVLLAQGIAQVQGNLLRESWGDLWQRIRAS